jgi:hypothetical protein
MFRKISTLMETFSIISDPDPPMGRLMQLLMPLVSPTMRSLVLVTLSDDHRSAESSLMYVPTITPLHALRHLTIHAIDPRWTPMLWPRLPAVTHLHVSYRDYLPTRPAMTNIMFLAMAMSHLSHLSLYGLPSSGLARKILRVILGKDEGKVRWTLRAQVESVRLSFRTPAPTSEGEDPVQNLQTHLQSTVSQYRTLEFLGAEDRVPDTPEGWLEFLLGQVIDMPDRDVQMNTAVTE